ncbi:hypothetical protein [Eisenbergiella sp.]
MKNRKTVIAGSIIFLLLAAVTAGGIRYNKIQARETERNQIPVSTKEAVILMEAVGTGKVQAGNRENMRRLAIYKNGKPVFEIQKGPSENQVDFEEWYLTAPYLSRQLVNVSDIYTFFEKYAAWTYIDYCENSLFIESGLSVEEEFSDTGKMTFLIGQKNENGNYYVKEKITGKVYEMDSAMVETMTELKPADFLMGIANLVYLTTIDGLKIHTKKTTASFVVETDSENNQVYMQEGKQEEKDGFKDMYASLLSITIQGEAGKKEKKGEPVLQLFFIRNTDKLKNVEISYYPYNQDFYLIVKDGQGEFLAEKEAVDKVIKELDEFCR